MPRLTLISTVLLFHCSSLTVDVWRLVADRVATGRNDDMILPLQSSKMYLHEQSLKQTHKISTKMVETNLFLKMFIWFWAKECFLFSLSFTKSASDLRKKKKKMLINAYIYMYTHKLSYNPYIGHQG